MIFRSDSISVNGVLSPMGGVHGFPASYTTTFSTLNYQSTIVEVGDKGSVVMKNLTFHSC